MTILFDIGHPAHVHYFRNLIEALRVNHRIIVTCRESRIVQQLLEHYQIPFYQIGTKGNNVISKAKKQIYLSKKIRDLIKAEGVDISTGASAAAVHGAQFTKATSILFDDDDQRVQPLMSKFITPFADIKLSPDALAFESLPGAIYYPGYHELAYLHPNRFKADPKILEKYGLTENDRYYILRFNAFKAHHDVNEGGMHINQKRELVALLKDYGKVFITTEAIIDREFEEYKMPIAPEDMHHFLSFAQMLVSDSQTMSTESAVLGVPSFRCNSFAGRLSILEEEEKRYGLTYAFLPRQFDWMYAKINKQLLSPDEKGDWKAKRQSLLQDKIDVTAFWLWFLDNYPSSIPAVQTKSVDFDQFRR